MSFMHANERYIGYISLFIKMKIIYGRIMVIKQLVAILSQNNCIRICQYSILIYNDFRFYIICTAEFIS